MDVPLERGIEIINAFTEFLNKGDFKPAWKEVAYHLEDNFWQIFSDQVDSDGNPWPEHAPSTVKAMGVHDLLIDSGELLTEVSNQSNYELTDRAMIAKVDLEYAAAQNYGTNTIPAREFMYLRQDTVDKIMETVYYFILSKLPEYGGSGGTHRY